MHEPDTSRLEGSAAPPGLAPQAAGLVPAPDGRRPGGQRGGRQPVHDTGPRRWSRAAPAPASTRSHMAAVSRATGSRARIAAPRSARLGLSRRALDPQSSRRHHPPRIWRLLSPQACRPRARRDALEPAKARPARPAARRSRHGSVARGDVAGHQQGAQTHQQTSLCLDESGCSPLPRVGRTYAPGARPRFCGNGIPVTICRRSVPAHPRANSPAMRRTTRCTRPMWWPFWSICCARSPAAWS
jgi:hypothetical protein